MKPGDRVVFNGRQGAHPVMAWVRPVYGGRWVHVVIEMRGRTATVRRFTEDHRRMANNVDVILDYPLPDGRTNLWVDDCELERITPWTTGQAPLIQMWQHREAMDRLSSLANMGWRPPRADRPPRRLVDSPMKVTPG